MKLELKQDIPFHKKGEQRELQVWANIMQSPNIEVFKRELDNGNLEPFFEIIEERVVLERRYNNRTGTYHLSKDDDSNFTEQEKELCEKALNNELIDLSRINDEEFIIWYYNNADVIFDDLIHKDYKIAGIKAVLTEYLKQKG